MDTKKTGLEEQDHPLKNTDNAFVQVGTNGEPVIPTKREDVENPQEVDRPTGNTES